MLRPFDRISSSFRTPWYRNDLLPQLQDKLAALADIELRYSLERDRIMAGSDTDISEETALAGLDESHRRERETHLRLLRELQLGTVEEMKNGRRQWPGS